MKIERLVPSIRSSAGFLCRNFALRKECENLKNVPKIVIGDGKFLYLLISIYIHGETLFARTIIRGMVANAHVKLYSKIRDEMDELMLCTKPLGGGFMDVNTGSKTIKIYGKCNYFGRADHRLTREILLESEKYKDFKITLGK